MNADDPQTPQMHDHPPVNIGRLRIACPVGLAPMAGFTDRAMRVLAFRYGAGLAMTEVVNAAGLVHGSRLTLHLFETCPDEYPLGAHIYGADARVMGEAARMIRDLGRFDFIDINAGCPVRKIVAKGAGAALMGDPALLAAIVAAVREGAGGLPVTVKTRIGLEPGRGAIEATARAVEDGGAAALCIHGRFACDKHGGEADWETIGRIKAACRLPVFGNGGVRTPTDALRLWRDYGVDGVLIGRAAIGNPWIFRDVRRLLAGRRACGRDLNELHAIVEEHLRGLATLKGLERRYRRAGSASAGNAAVKVLRPHLLRYVTGLPGWRNVRRHLNDFESIDQVLAAVDSVVASAPSPGTGHD